MKLIGMEVLITGYSAYNKPKRVYKYQFDNGRTIVQQQKSLTRATKAAINEGQTPKEGRKVARYLDQLVKSGLYGKLQKDVVRRLVEEKLMELLHSGFLERDERE